VKEAALRQVFVGFGFEVVTTDGMSFDEQRAAFGEAAIVASESGAAQANMLLAPASAILVCLQAEAGSVDVYADRVGHAGQPSIFLTGTVESLRPPKTYHARFSVGLDDLRSSLTRILQSREAAIAAGSRQSIVKVAL
jgi:hypothetical protein